MLIPLSITQYNFFVLLLPDHLAWTKWKRRHLILLCILIWKIKKGPQFLYMTMHLARNFDNNVSVNFPLVDSTCRLIKKRTDRPGPDPYQRLSTNLIFSAAVFTIIKTDGLVYLLTYTSSSHKFYALCLFFCFYLLFCGLKIWSCFE